MLEKSTPLWNGKGSNEDKVQDSETSLLVSKKAEKTISTIMRQPKSHVLMPHVFSGGYLNFFSYLPVGRIPLDRVPYSNPWFSHSQRISFFAGAPPLYADLRRALWLQKCRRRASLPGPVRRSPWPGLRKSRNDLDDNMQYILKQIL